MLGRLFPFTCLLGIGEWGRSRPSPWTELRLQRVALGAALCWTAQCAPVQQKPAPMARPCGDTNQLSGGLGCDC